MPLQAVIFVSSSHLIHVLYVYMYLDSHLAKFQVFLLGGCLVGFCYLVFFFFFQLSVRLSLMHTAFVSVKIISRCGHKILYQKKNSSDL